MTTFDYPHPTPDEKRVGLHYKPFWLIWLTSPFAIQPLARAKFLQPGLNPRSRANMIIEEIEVAGQDREELFAQQPTARHPLIIVSTPVEIWPVDFGGGKFSFEPAEELLMAGMHAQSHLRLLAVTAEVPFSNQDSDQKPLFELI